MTFTNPLPSLDEQPIWFNLAVFLVTAGAIWLAGTRLSVYVDVFAERKKLGRAFIGMILLGTLVSLPELATGVTASLIGNPALGINNLLGAVPLQIAVFLPLIDFRLGRSLALTYFAPSPTLLLEGILLALLLAAGAAAILAGERYSVLGIGLWTILLVLAYLAAAYTVAETRGRAHWQPIPERPEPREEEQKVERKREEVERERARHERGYQKIPDTRLFLYIGAAALVVLVAGVVLAQVGDAIAQQTGLGASIVGVLLLALATSLPELSTVFSAARIGSYQLAVGELMGANMLKVALLFVLDAAYREGPILNTVDTFTAFATVLGVLATCIYLVGIVERRDRVVWRLGVDSILALVVYLVGLVILFSLQ